MSVEVLISPRISFSHDLNPIDDAIDDDDRSNIPIEIYPYPSCSVSDSAFEFVFTSHNGTLIRQSSTADQLFSDGKLLPIPIEEILSTSKDHITIIQSDDQQISQLKKPAVPDSYVKRENGKLCNVNNTDLKLKEQKKIRSLKELLLESLDDDDEEFPEEEAPSPLLKPPAVIATASPSRNFWNFRRSSSLNNFDGRKLAKQLGISSKLKLQLLSRSKSTGGNISSTTTESAATISILVNNDTSPTTILEEVENKSDGWNFRRSKSVGWGGGGGGGSNNNNKRNNNKGSSFGLIKTLRKTGLLTTRANPTGKLPPEEKRVVVIDPITKQTNDTRFRRSASLNNYYPTGYGYSNQHQRFGRCKSAGQTSATTQTTELQKQNSTKRRQSCSSASSDVDGKFSGWRKCQAGRGSGKGVYYGNCSSNSTAVRVNPVALNLPSPYISRVSLDVFGFGSLFCNGKIKNKKHINNTTQPAPV